MKISTSTSSIKVSELSTLYPDMTLSEVKEILKAEPEDISEDRKIELEEMVIRTCPKAGEGVNNWLPYAKAIFDREPFRYKDETIAGILTDAIILAGRQPRAQEIERVIKNITFGGVKTSAGTNVVRAASASIYHREVQQQQWKLTPEECKGSQEKLCSLSPVKDPWELPTWEVLGRSYSSEDVLCFAKYKNDRKTSHLLRMRGISLYRFERLDPFMVPSPVIGKGAMTKEGDFSCRALENFGERAYIITEFDSGSLDEQAAKILWLQGKTSLKLLMVVWTTSRGFHAWWRTKGIPEHRIMGFFAIARGIRCCLGTKTINQLVRTPNVVKRINEDQDQGLRQSVIYLYEDAN